MTHAGPIDPPLLARPAVMAATATATVAARPAAMAAAASRPGLSGRELSRRVGARVPNDIKLSSYTHSISRQAMRYVGRA
jgi:hypothetical protein